MPDELDRIAEDISAFYGGIVPKERIYEALAQLRDAEVAADD